MNQTPHGRAERGDLVLRPCSPGDEMAIVDLFRESYGRSLSVPAWLWRFRDAPDGDGVVTLCWDGRILAAHYGISTVRLSIAGSAHLTGLSGTTMTHPAYRGRGLFPLLAADVYTRMAANGMPLVWGFPNANSHRGFARDLGWQDIHEIPSFRLDLAGPKSVPTLGSEVVLLPGFSPQFDRLWQEVCGDYAVIACRDQRHLEWRYASKPGEHYRTLGFFEGEELRGYAVVKRYREELQIVDILTVRDDEVGVRLVLGAARLALEESATAVSMWLNVTHPLHRALEKLGFRLGAPVTYFAGRVLRSGLPKREVYDHRCWYMTMGDSDVY